jgi:hypothetical protein
LSVTFSHGSAAAPPPDLIQAAQDDGRGLRRLRRRTVIFLAVLLFAVGLPSLALSGHIGTEWALAFGDTTSVTATVTGSAPSDQLSRTCSLTDIDVIWTAPVGDHTGQFTVCDDQAGQFAAGSTVQVDVLPGDSSVIQGEDRGSAVFGVVLETIVLVFILLLLAAGVWQLFRLAAARRHWRTAPMLPAVVFPAGSKRSRDGGQPTWIVPVGDTVPWTRPPSLKARRRTCLANISVPLGTRAEASGLDPENALVLNVLQRPKDPVRLASGDPVWLAPAGRTMRTHRRAAPYAIVRTTDQQVFWANGLPMPGQGW